MQALCHPAVGLEVGKLRAEDRRGDRKLAAFGMTLLALRMQKCSKEHLFLFFFISPIINSLGPVNGGGG